MLGSRLNLERKSGDIIAPPYLALAHKSMIKITSSRLNHVTINVLLIKRLPIVAVACLSKRVSASGSVESRAIYDFPRAVTFITYAAAAPIGICYLPLIHASIS